MLKILLPIQNGCARAVWGEFCKCGATNHESKFRQNACISMGEPNRSDKFTDTLVPTKPAKGLSTILDFTQICHGLPIGWERSSQAIPPPEPVLRGYDQAPCSSGRVKAPQPGTPPAESAVGDDVVLAEAHEIHVYIAPIPTVPVNIVRPLPLQFPSDYLLTPRDVL